MDSHEGPLRPVAVLLDLFGTVFQLEPLGKSLEAAGVPASALKLWFARILRNGWGLDLAGRYVPFRAVASGALETLMVEFGMTPDRQKRDAVLDAFTTLPAYPDVGPALEQLRAGGVRIAALGNGSASTIGPLLERARLSHLIERTFSIDEVQHWKPHPAPYLHAVRALALPPAHVTMIAAHAWDTQGAQRAGLRGAWVSRLEKHADSAMEAPSLIGGTVEEVAASLLSAPARES